jgi:hypothetical protein
MRIAKYLLVKKATETDEHSLDIDKADKEKNADYCAF